MLSHEKSDNLKDQSITTNIIKKNYIWNDFIFTWVGQNLFFFLGGGERFWNFQLKILHYACSPSSHITSVKEHPSQKGCQATKTSEVRWFQDLCNFIMQFFSFGFYKPLQSINNWDNSGLKDSDSYKFNPKVGIFFFLFYVSWAVMVLHSFCSIFPH